MCSKTSLYNRGLVRSVLFHVSSPPSSSEKTTSYRRTSSGGGSQGKCGVLSPSCVGSQEELYCSLVGNNPGLTLAPAPAPSSSPTVTCAPRPRRNAMVQSHRNPSLLYSAYSLSSPYHNLRTVFLWRISKGLSPPGLWQQATPEACQGFSGLQSSQF